MVQPIKNPANNQPVQRAQVQQPRVVQPIQRRIPVQQQATSQPVQRAQVQQPRVVQPIQRAQVQQPEIDSSAQDQPGEKKDLKLWILIGAVALGVAIVLVGIYLYFF